MTNDTIFNLLVLTCTLQGLTICYLKENNSRTDIQIAKSLHILTWTVTMIIAFHFSRLA